MEVSEKVVNEIGKDPNSPNVLGNRWESPIWWSPSVPEESL